MVKKIHFLLAFSSTLFITWNEISSTRSTEENFLLNSSTHKKAVTTLLQKMANSRNLEDALPFLILIIFSFPLSISASEEVLLNTCGVKEQNVILNSKHSCKLREQVEEIRPYLSGIKDKIHRIVPDVAVIQKCGGPCLRSSHRCIAVTKRNITIPVMLVMSRFPHGTHETLCSNLTLQEDVSCRCDCPLQPADCHNSLLQHNVLAEEKFFEPNSCKCLCRNHRARQACFKSNMEWSEDECQCRCPADTWQPCSSGYIFDFSNTCSCVPEVMGSSLGLYIAILILGLSSVTIVSGIAVMYKRKSGFFKQNKMTEKDMDIRKERTICEAKYNWEEDEETEDQDGC